MRMVGWICNVKVKDRVPSSERETRYNWYNLDTTAKQVAMVWACVAKRRHWLSEKMYGIWGEGSIPRGRPKRTWRDNSNNNNRFMALCPGLPGWAGTRRNTHPPTILIIIQSLSASSIYHDPYHPPWSNYVLGNLFTQPLSMSSLVYLLVWSPPPHIPYISSPNQCLFFAA